MVHLMHCGCTWKFKVLGGEMIQANKAESCDQPAYCDTPIANTPFICSLLLLCAWSHCTLHFLFCSLINKIIWHLGLFRLYYPFSFFLTFHFLIMVLVMNTEHISFSCTSCTKAVCPNLLSAGVFCAFLCSCPFFFLFFNQEYESVTDNASL